MKELTEVFQRTADPEELLRSDLSAYSRRFDKVADDCKEIMKSPITDPVKVYNIGEQYKNLSDLKQAFAKSLDKESGKSENRQDETIQQTPTQYKARLFHWLRLKD